MNPPETTPPAVPEKKKSRFTRKNIFLALGVLTLIAVIAGVWYFINASRYVYTDKAELEAPLIQLAPQTAGVLMHVSVDEGDMLAQSQPVARVGDEILRTQIAGLAVTVQKDIGAAYAPGKPVVTMIDPQELRVIARIEEDKGLKDVHKGQRVIFTVDAFGSQQFEGTVEAVSATKRADDVVFNISDKREVKEFDVKIDYDHEQLKEFQNGMSARVWIVK
jgi:multidrug resistance efflux pump